MQSYENYVVLHIETDAVIQIKYSGSVDLMYVSFFRIKSPVNCLQIYIDYTSVGP